MDEMDLAIDYVRRVIPLTPEEGDYFSSLLRIRKVRKKQAIAQPGFPCKHRSYIAKGAMRAYLVDDAGQEHTVKLGIEDWWISDYASYTFQQPATMFVEAIEDSVLVQIAYDDEQRLMETVPKFERFFRIITQRGYAFLQQRLLSNLSKTAGQRYDDFLIDHPELAKRIPQYVLASYLGISTEFLSKIRSDKRKKVDLS